MPDSRQPRQSHICRLCYLHIQDLGPGSRKLHWAKCSQIRRLELWKRITSYEINFHWNYQQMTYISARYQTKSLLHSLNSKLHAGHQAIHDAAMPIIIAWRNEEREFGNNDYVDCVLSMNRNQHIASAAITDLILQVFSYHGTSLPAILGIEDTFWEHSRTIDFNMEENSWLLQWLRLSAKDRNHRIWYIRNMFHHEFLPRGRPEKSARTLRQKLSDLWRCCQVYEYSSGPWTVEQDTALIFKAREFCTFEQCVYKFIVHCYASAWKLKSADAIRSRMRLLGCEKVVREERKKASEWLAIQEGPRSMAEVFRSGRRASF